MTHRYRVLVWIDHQVVRMIAPPGGAKTELRTHITQRHPQFAARIYGVETLDHPTDGELLAHGPKFFKADDRMRLQL